MLKKLTASLLALSMVGSLYGCGNPDIERASENIVNHIAAVVSEDEDAEKSKMPVQTKSDAEPGTEEALAEVQRIMRQFEEACKENDQETMAELMDVELLYYMEHSKLADPQTYLEFYKKEVTQNSDSPYNSFGKNNMTFSDQTPAYCPEKVAEYNKFFQQMDETSIEETAFADTFHIDAVYIYRFEVDSKSNVNSVTDDTVGDGFKIELNNGDVSVGMDIAVIRINGEWKIDFVIPMMQVLLDMMQGFTDGLDIN